MTDITSELSREHQLILRYLEVAERLALNTRPGDLFDASPLARHTLLFLEFIKKFSDDFHHAKEETVLFKVLTRPGVLNHCNPIPQMLHEHDAGRARNGRGG